MIIERNKKAFEKSPEGFYSSKQDCFYSLIPAISSSIAVVRDFGRSIG
jgi:hypothetical protein